VLFKGNVMLRAGVLFACVFTAIAWSATTPAQSGGQDPALQEYLAGNGLLNRGLFELAAKEYRKFLDDHGDHEKAPVARYGLGVCLFRMKRYEDAAGELESLAKLRRFPYSVEVGTILGQCRLAMGDHQAAAESFGRVAREAPEHDLADDAVSGWVEALYLGGSYDQAITQAQRAVEQWPPGPLRERVELFWGLSEMSRGRDEAAAQRFALLLDTYPGGAFHERASLLLAQCRQRTGALDEAADNYNAVLQDEGAHFIPDALLGLGTIFVQQGESERAAPLLDRLLRQFPDAVQITAARFYRARAFFDSGEYESALLLFGEVAVEKGPFADAGAYWTAKCRLRQGAHVEAATLLEQAAERFPESPLLPEMHYDRAVALIQAEQYEASVKVLSVYREGFRDHAMWLDGVHLAAVAAHHLGDYGGSRTLCREFIKRGGDHELAAPVAFLLAENDFLLGEFDDAVAGYQRWLDLYADHAEADKARFRLGMALYRRQRFDEAKEYLAAVARLASGDAAFRPAVIALGDISFHGGEWKWAAGYFEQYLAAEPSPPAADDALLKLGLSLQREGQFAEAMSAYDRLIERHPEGPHHLQAMFERGQALVALGKPGPAADAFQAVIEKDGDSPLATYAMNHLATLAMQNRDFAGAAEQFKRVLERAPDSEIQVHALFQEGQASMASSEFAAAQQAFEKFLDKFSDHALAIEARAQLAISLARQDRFKEAVKVIQLVEGAAKSSLSPRLYGSLLYEKAWCLSRLEKTEDSAASYRALLDAPGASEATVAHGLLELAGIELSAKRYDSAFELLSRLRSLIAAGSTEISAQVREQGTYRLAVCAFETDKMQEATSFFEEFLSEFRESPLLASASYFAGESLFRQGRHEPSIAHFQRVADRFPADAAYGPSLLRLGEALASAHRWAKSEEAFTTYLGRFADKAQWFQARFGVGWAREHQSRYPEAIRSYREVVAGHRGPTAARAQFQIGECLFAQKKYDDAVAELLKVDILYAYPEWSAGALYEAGRCFEQMAKIGEAREQFKTVVEKHEDTHWAKLASERLGELSKSTKPGA
jgi:TolA-binding protein